MNNNSFYRYKNVKNSFSKKNGSKYKKKRNFNEKKSSTPSYLEIPSKQPLF